MNSHHDAKFSTWSRTLEDAPAQPTRWQDQWPGIAASLIGIVMVAAVGFAPGLAHNAAHDVRHAVAFPCH